LNAIQINHYKNQTIIGAQVILKDFLEKGIWRKLKACLIESGCLSS
jgi:hypothetical protein